MHLHEHPLKRYTFGQTTGLLLLKLLANTRVTGNQLSAFVIFYTLLPLFFITKGTQPNAIIGSLLLLLIITIDHMDGALARYKNQMSYMGAYLERMHHRLIPPMLFMGLSIYTYKFFNNPWFITIGLAIMYIMFLTHWSGLSKYEIISMCSWYQPRASLETIKFDFSKPQSSA